MAKYRVTQTIQSPGNEPVELPWLKSGDELETADTILGILRLSRPNPDDEFPHFHPTLLAINVTLIPEEN